MLNINTMSKILNGMDHPLSFDQMGGLDSCELVTKVMSDLRVLGLLEADHASGMVNLGIIIWSCLLQAAAQNLPHPLNKYLIFIQILWA